MKIPELLSPAGDLEKAYYAFKYGADAIYCGLPFFSLRTRMNFFTEKDLTEIIPFAHKNNKKVYVTVNVFPHEEMLPLIKKHLKFLKEIKPDAVIVADLGVLSLANQILPNIEKHLSVQTTTLNTSSIKFWQKNGVSRIILAREIALNEIKKIHEVIPEIELEYFVHGSICMAYSGRCLISNFLASRDANQGDCAHSCRWNYRIYDENGYELIKNKNQNLEKKINIHTLEKKKYWEEELRKDEFIPVEEDFAGTHIMSSRDLCLIEHLKEISAGGICSVKIEGRNKTLYYLSVITRAYREALNDLEAGRNFQKILWKEINSVANRGFFTGFLKGQPSFQAQQYEENKTESDYDFVGIVQGWDSGRIKFEVKNRIDEGDLIEFIFPEMSQDFAVTAENLEKDGESVLALHGGNGSGSIDCEKKVDVGVLMRKKVK